MEALERILDGAHPLDVEDVSLDDADGRAAARPVRARRSLPLWDNAAKDGYAVAVADLAPLASGSAPDEGLALPVAGEVAAGAGLGAALARGTALRIMTGAPVPSGADAVIPVEESAGPAGPGRFAAPGETVRFFARPASGTNVRSGGADVREGDVVLEPGQTVTPARIALLAALGEASVHAFRRPRVAIIPTGDELVEAGAEAPPGKLHSSNAHGLAALVQRAGGLPRRLPIVPDDRLLIRSAVFVALATSEIVVTSGGVSAGAHDHVRGVLEEAGGGLVFWKVRMRPGEPLVFARTSDLAGTGRVPTRYLFGLPGNPTSAFVTFVEFVRPLLRRLAGYARIFLPAIRARLAERLRVEPGRISFVRVRVSRDARGLYLARPTGPQGSGFLRPLAEADGLLVAGPEETDLAPRTPCVVQLLHAPSGWTPEPFDLREGSVIFSAP